MPSEENSHPTYARIAVNVPHVQGVFDYHLPEFLQDKVSIGHLVTVPFGKQTVQGIIIEFPPIPEVIQTKAVSSLLDPLPVVTPKQILLAEKIAHDTLSPLGVTIHAMLPGGLSIKADVQYSLTDISKELLDSGEPLLQELSPPQQRFLDVLIERGPLRGRQLDRTFPHKNWRSTAGSLERRGIITSQGILQEPIVGPKLERRIHFIGGYEDTQEQMDTLAKPGFPDALRRRQMILNQVMESDIDLPLSAVYQNSGGNLADIKQLVKRGLIEVIEAPIIRDPLDDIQPQPHPKPQLTVDQEKIWQEIESSFSEDGPAPFLLHGVTGSGKTEKENITL